ncbi:heme peroxidase [Roseovarius sp. THAF9]|nr:heme peroxidase [Roseovarius sp. THAF9]
MPPKVKDDLPDPETLKVLFERPDGNQRMCPKSTSLFPAFAQYLTDGFLRTESDGIITPSLKELLDPEDFDTRTRLRRNTSNHEIDLCTLYGRTHMQTLALRLRSEEAGQKGRLKSQILNAEEYPPFLYSLGDTTPLEKFSVLDGPLVSEDLDQEKRDALFAVGGDRVNSVPQTSMINTLLLREHNRLAAEIETENPTWDDTRVFETARNIMIVLFIKIVVEEYINHISPLPFKIRADPSVAWDAPWNRPNWITTEFSLLYRWHALIPDNVTWGGTSYPIGKTIQDNRFLIANGLLKSFVEVSDTAAAELGPQNTARELLDVEVSSIMQDRACDLAGFSDYCAYLGLDRPTSTRTISSRPDVAEKLSGAYDNVRDVEFFVGLFCEDRVPNSPLPRLVLAFVALDAFSQALTNPLLSKHVFKPSTFSRTGWKTIQKTSSIRDLLARNIPENIGDAFVGMTRRDWVPE